MRLQRSKLVADPRQLRQFDAPPTTDRYRGHCMLSISVAERARGAIVPKTPTTGAALQPLHAPTQRERRSEPRHRVVRTATIAQPAGQSAMPCVVLDISGSGAKLAVHRDVEVPGLFELTIDREGVVVSCRVAWRKGSLIGVQFLGGTKRRA